MSAAAFDTLSVARDLEAAGLDRGPAEAIARAISHGGERAATKADLDSATAGLRADLDSATAGLRADFYRALWIQGVSIVTLIGGLIAIAAALKLL